MAIDGTYLRDNLIVVQCLYLYIVYALKHLQLKDAHGDTLLEFIQSAVRLHPHLWELLPGSCAPTEPTPPLDNEDIPRCHCGRGRQMQRPEEQLCCRRSHGRCLVETAERDINGAVLMLRSVGLVALRDVNDLFAYNVQP